MEAWDRSATPSNIKSGFRSTGIFPFDRNIFTEQDFLCSFVTDRPENNANESKSNTSQILSQNENNASQGKVQNADGNSSAPKSPEPGTSGTQFVSPEVLRPYPKAPVRKESTKGRKRGRSMIATDTPEKLEIEKRQEKRNRH
ncbi:hypothetical protein MML48_9g00007883 [Holotrichia oblita]|uniref:Uncharacterized protein n=1 Tax=Holotrichia oblita TaxID=644536 RepID=A0ACB9SKB7_HOLOL|nr:hypothetical protein MML48_9g00007883 [Holotrichia oblita]